MRALKENLKTIKAYGTADTVNAEGFSAWTPSDTTLLEQLAMTGTLGNSFYANAKETAADAVKLLERSDAAELAFADAKWVVAPDVSGSMCSPIGESSVLSYVAVSAMFVGFFLTGLKDVTVLPWDTEVRNYTVSASAPLMWHIDAITSMVEGGTYMETGVKHMIRNRIETDYAVFLTDTEEYGSGWLAAWKDYHRRYPKAVAFVLRGDGYMTSPIPEAEAAELNVYQIFGWNDSVIDDMKVVIKGRKAA